MIQQNNSPRPHWITLWLTRSFGFSVLFSIARILWYAWDNWSLQKGLEQWLSECREKVGGLFVLIFGSLIGFGLLTWLEERRIKRKRQHENGEVKTP